MTDERGPKPADLWQQVQALPWYHTLDLGQGVVTPGAYDHRPYLHLYGLPQGMAGQTALDVGAASGFFSFEMERRGAQVTAIDLPAWQEHDFGPRYEPDMAHDQAQRYLQEPILLARRALGSQITKREMSIYDLSPETVGRFDLVFCGSLLLHLSDPARALWQLQSVTRGQAIIATVIDPSPDPEPRALFVGHGRGDVWWYPNRACLEAMVEAAGFAGWQWVSTFRLDYADGQAGQPHGVIRAWNGTPLPEAGTEAQTSPVQTAGSDDLAEAARSLAACRSEAERLQALVTAYEQGRVMRLMTGFQRAWRHLRGQI
jgi:tRNA (mo5U34)-methyltransferase